MVPRRPSKTFCRGAGYEIWVLCQPANTVSLTLHLCRQTAPRGYPHNVVPAKSKLLFDTNRGNAARPSNNTDASPPFCSWRWSTSGMRGSWVECQYGGLSVGGGAPRRGAALGEWFGFLTVGYLPHNINADLPPLRVCVLQHGARLPRGDDTSLRRGASVVVAVDQDVGTVIGVCARSRLQP